MLTVIIIIRIQTSVKRSLSAEVLNLRHNSQYLLNLTKKYNCEVTCTLQRNNMMRRRRMIPAQTARMMTHSGTAAGFCT